MIEVRGSTGLAARWAPPMGCGPRRRLTSPRSSPTRTTEPYPDLSARAGFGERCFGLGKSFARSGRRRRQRTFFTARRPIERRRVDRPRVVVNAGRTLVEVLALALLTLRQRDLVRDERRSAVRPSRARSQPIRVFHGGTPDSAGGRRLRFKADGLVDAAAPRPRRILESPRQPAQDGETFSLPTREPRGCAPGPQRPPRPRGGCRERARPPPGPGNPPREARARSPAGPSLRARTSGARADRT